MKKEMQEFEERFAETLSGAALPMDTVLHHVGAVTGKRLRPRLVFLSAHLFGEVNESTWRTALFVELLHTATLIHDDVVDDSDTRRGQPSVNAKWDNRTAVLVGDYLLSKAIQQLSEPFDNLILKEMLSTTLVMSEGEMIQNMASGNGLGEFSETTYLEIITRKTASLLRSCCVSGALSVGVSEELINKVGEFGINLGLVFQMRDDILDHDDPMIAAFAERLIPEYLDKTMKTLDALAPFVKNAEALEELRALSLFCSERGY